MPDRDPENRLGLEKTLVISLDRADYVPLLKLQRHLNFLSNERLLNDTLILLQHNDVYTMGIHRNSSELLSEDVRAIEVERGGSVTFHGPGQVVVYLIVNLRNHGMNIRDLIVQVQEKLVRLLEGYGIVAEGRLRGETGVWVGKKKICSVGFAIRGFSTLHGIALNVSTDLRKFESIMPCGMQSSVMTSIQNETGKPILAEEVQEILKRELASSLEMKNIVEINSLKELGNYSVGNGLRLLPEELLKIVV